MRRTAMCERFLSYFPKESEHFKGWDDVRVTSDFRSLKCLLAILSVMDAFEAHSSAGETIQSSRWSYICEKQSFQFDFLFQ